MIKKFLTSPPFLLVAGCCQIYIGLGLLGLIGGWTGSASVVRCMVGSLLTLTGLNSAHRGLGVDGSRRWFWVSASIAAGLTLATGSRRALAGLLILAAVIGFAALVAARARRNKGRP